MNSEGQQTEPTSTRHGSAVRRYVASVVGATLALILGALIINILVDPLWYFSGNRLTGKNGLFNERFSKASYYYKHRGEFDCMLFGASSGTTLDSNDIPNAKCYNFAFSGGTLEEIAAFGKYVKAVGRTPDTIIVAIDVVHLINNPRPPKTPDFVRSLGGPPSFIGSYTSLPTAEHSIKELLFEKYDARYYRASDFVCTVDVNHVVYAPTAVVVPGRSNARWGAQRVDHIASLRHEFPNARFIAYAPVVSSWETAEIFLNGQLPQYLAVRHDMALKFDEFYDYSIPSPASESTSDMIDGTHQTPQANAVIARALGGSPAPDVVLPAKLSKADYIEQYRARVVDFIDRHKVRAAP